MSKEKRSLLIHLTLGQCPKLNVIKFDIFIIIQNYCPKLWLLFSNGSHEIYLSITKYYYFVWKKTLNINISMNKILKAHETFCILQIFSVNKVLKNYIIFAFFVFLAKNSWYISIA